MACVSLVPGGCCRVVLREAGGRVASARGARPGTPRRPSRGGGSRVGVAQGPAGGRTPLYCTPRDWRARARLRPQTLGRPEGAFPAGGLVGHGRGPGPTWYACVPPVR